MQTLLKKAAALVPERKSYFVIDPNQVLSAVLTSAKDMGELLAAWGALSKRMELAQSNLTKYQSEVSSIQENLLSPVSTALDIYERMPSDLRAADAVEYLYDQVPHLRSLWPAGYNQQADSISATIEVPEDLLAAFPDREPESRPVTVFYSAEGERREINISPRSSHGAGPDFMVPPAEGEPTRRHAHRAEPAPVERPSTPEWRARRDGKEREVIPERLQEPLPRTGLMSAAPRFKNADELLMPKMPQDATLGFSHSWTESSRSTSTRRVRPLSNLYHGLGALKLDEPPRNLENISMRRERLGNRRPRSRLLGQGPPAHHLHIAGKTRQLDVDPAITLSVLLLGNLVKSLGVRETGIRERDQLLDIPETEMEEGRTRRTTREGVETMEEGGDLFLLLPLVAGAGDLLVEVEGIRLPHQNQEETLPLPPGAPYGTMVPTIEPKLKVESLPEWDGNHESAIDYFWEIIQLASLLGNDASGPPRKFRRANLAEIEEEEGFEIVEDESTPVAMAASSELDPDSATTLRSVYQTLTRRQRPPPKGGYPFPKNDHARTKTGKEPPSPCKVCGSSRHWDRECPNWEEWLDKRKRGALLVSSSDDYDDTEVLYHSAYLVLQNSSDSRQSF
ncbi:hypothetical protein R3P38DRAFT_3195463 [Favolaschia claudopus]|uniref:Uncharacterized protein n=1 Tax=Favolaschia claudopus TaxID=2862362 RepID=A0AAV9Z693_9AGAR